MPRDLFGDVVDPSITLGTRKWYSVPLSFLVHTLAIGLLVVAPLMATGVLPAPSSRTPFMAIEPPPLPQPPPLRRAPTHALPSASRNAAPVVAPSEIVPERDLLPGFEATDPGIGVPGGVPIEGAIVIAPPPVVAPPPPPKVRPGGQIRTPERISYASPTYPAVALAARVQGIVIIEATIDPSGRVQDARVLRSASPLLNEAALTAVRHWVYTPTLLNGVPVSVVMTVTVNFQMK
jgi:protein TonB